MEAPAAEDGAAGLPDDAAGALSPHRGAAAALSPRAFAGVVQLSAGNFACIAPVNGREMLLAGFATSAAAAEEYDKLQRALSKERPVVNTPLHPGEVQAVPAQRAGEAERAARQLAALLTKPFLPAALPLAAAVPAAPRLYKGIKSSDKKFTALAYVEDGSKPKYGGSFDTAEAAAHAYDEMMRQHNLRVVNFPQLPGEVQAVYGEQTRITLKRHEHDSNRVANPVHRNFGPRLATVLPLVEGTRQYKGVTAEGALFMANAGTATGASSNRRYLGLFDSAKEAADAYDAHVRQLTPAGVAAVVNTPLHAGEIQAVRGEEDKTTRRSAVANAARDAVQRRAAGLPAPAVAPADALPPAAAVAVAKRKRSRPSNAERAAHAAAAAAGGGGSADDVLAFLRAISPPLVDIDRVVACASACGLQMSQLRDAVRAPAHEGASLLHQLYGIMGIWRGADKIALTVALLPFA